MSSIPLLHRSSLSLLPLQCCNCNNFLAYILLLISSLLFSLSGNNRDIKRNIYNNKTCPYHQRHHINSSTCNSNHKNCFCSSPIKSFIPQYLIGFANFYVAKSLLSTEPAERVVNSITYRGNQTSDTYILTSLKTCNKNSRSSNTNWEFGKSNFDLPVAQGRRSFECPQPEDKQTLHEESEYCCFVNHNNNNCRKRCLLNGNSVLDNKINSGSRSKLFIKFNTDNYTKQPNLTTLTVVLKRGVTAAYIKSASVDLTLHFLENTFTPDHNCENSSATSKHLNNNKKPFSISSGQRLSSSSLTPLLQEKQQSTHSNKNTGLSSKLHVFVQQRKSTSQSRKLQHLLVDVIIYA